MDFNLPAALTAAAAFTLGAAIISSGPYGERPRVAWTLFGIGAALGIAAAGLGFA